MIKYSIFLLLTAIAFSSPAQLVLNGTVTGLKDSTWIYLRTASPERRLDSAQVIAGRFRLTATLDEKACRMAVHTANYRDYVFFWAEDGFMTLSLRSGAFKKGTISGSAVQDEDRAFAAIKAPFIAMQDSLQSLMDTTKDAEKRKVLRAQLNEARKKEQQLDMSYVRNHPRSWVAINLLDIYASTCGRETAKELYAGMDSALKQTRYGKNVNAFITLNKSPKTGDHFEDFTQLNTSGKKVALSDIKGKYVLLEFWASWCGPCREANPRLVQTYYRFKDKGFAILGVSLDENKAGWLKAIEDDGLAWENISDLKGDKNEAAMIYGINAVPSNFLIDAQGTIIAVNLRGASLEKKLEELLP